MVSENTMRKDIEKIFNNGFRHEKRRKKWPGKLLPQQIEELKAYKGFYENKPSPRGGNIKPASLWNSLMCLRKLGVYLQKPYKDATKQEIISFITSLNGLSDSTLANWKVIIRSFYKWQHGMHKPHDFPEVVDDPLLVPQRPKNKKKPQHLLTAEELKQLLDVARNNRNKCIVMMSVGEGGMRAGEIVSGNLDSIKFDSRGVRYWPDRSKSKERYVRLINTEPFLRRYLNEEYELDKDNKQNPLFYARAGFTHGQRLNPNALTELLHRLAKKAGIKKRVYSHLGRFINITKLAKEGMSDQLNAKRHGISVNTLQRVYSVLDDKDADDAYTKIRGELTEKEQEDLKEEAKKLAPKICARCKERFPNKPELYKHPATAIVCTCGMMLDGKTNDEDLEAKFFSSMAEQYFKVAAKMPDMSLKEFMQKLREKL